jgi:hypothetical protein
MSRIPTHTVEDAPAASRPLPECACPDGAFSGGPGGVHVAARRDCRARHLRPEAGCGTDSRNCGYGRQRLHDRYRQSTRPHERLGRRADRRGTPTSDVKIDVLTNLVREAAANSGNVTDATWKAAQQAGWSDEQLTDAFAYLGLTVFTGYFLNYAQTDMDALW